MDDAGDEGLEANEPVVPISEVKRLEAKNRDLEHASARVWSASFSPDGARVLTASDDQTARVWQADGSGDPIVLRGHTGLVISAVFSPDGSRVLTASDDNTVRIWSADGSGSPIVLEAGDDQVFGAQFSPDGARILVASDKAARLWNGDGSGPPMLLSGHGDWVRSVAWSPDGSHVVTGSSDQTARVWTTDPNTLEHLRTVLWQATQFCHAPETRTELFGELETIAAANYRRCVELTKACAASSFADCHAQVIERF